MRVLPVLCAVSCLFGIGVAWTDRDFEEVAAWLMALLGWGWIAAINRTRTEAP